MVGFSLTADREPIDPLDRGGAGSASLRDGAGVVLGARAEVPSQIPEMV